MLIKLLTNIKNETKSLQRFLSEPYFKWVLFWCGATSVIFTYIFWNYGLGIAEAIASLYSLNFNSTLIIGVAAILIFGGIFIFVINPVDQFKKQNIHNKPSWVFYSFWGFINTFIIYSSFLFTYQVREYWWNGTWSYFFVVPLVLIILKWIIESVGPKVDLTFRRFAAGSVGVKDDKLDFKTSAKNVANGLSNLKSYVNVVGLYGGLGFGKSSYARMILESFDTNKTLYTYISLTETNEAKDFSKLFSERWLDTLAERYPKIDVTSCLPFMDSILRESGNGIISEILKIISTINLGLAKTKAVFFDEFYSENKPVFTTSTVAKLFGNITDIKESLWVIVVDEIERAQFEEIYRLVEIVERFKNEGRSGLPTKLLFLFCISEPDLNNYLDAFSDSDPRARLLKTFFYEDPKSITHREFLPPVEPAVKQKYVLEQLNKIIDREGLEVPKEVNPHAIGDPSTKFMDHKDAAEYTIAILRENSPRVISRVTTALDFFYNAFRNRAGDLQKNAIRFNDIVTLEYIKIKYPYLIDFFIKTVHVLVNQAEMHNIDAYFTKKELEEKKIGLIGWIEMVTGRKIPDTEKPDVLKMVGLVMYYYFDFLNKDYDTKSKDKYFGTTSYPEIMCDYLSLMAEGTETNYRKNNRFYQKHKSNPDGFIQKLDNKELLSYTRFVFDVPNAPVQLNMDLIQELSDRVIKQKIEVDLINVADTALDEAIYQFVFQIVAVAEKERESDYASENISKSFEALKAILSSPKVITGLKYIILSSLVNNERGGGSNIHFRLENAFKKILRYYDTEMRELIKAVFKEAEDRYLSGNRVLYKYEENFFYTLYQGWSGSKDAIEEIEKIRAAAKRGLKNCHEAIKLYWRKYPIGEGWRNLNDVFDSDHFFSMSDTNNPVYMPLETLIEITKQAKINDTEIQAKLKFWESIKDTPKLKELSVIKDDQSTLKSFLTRNNFLNADVKMIEAPKPGVEQDPGQE
jgi:hypothetical protein